MCEHTLSRRRLLGGAGAVLSVTVAGCLGESEPETDVEPISLDGGRGCDVCGMVIEGGYGPNGQVHYDGDYPDDRDGPAHYDSVRELYTDRFAQRQRGNEPIATFLTDYAAVDVEIERRDGDPYVAGTVAPETFIEPDDAVFVVESGVQGAMGSELLPFSEESAAAAFVGEHGGEIVESDEVTQTLVESL